jgi:hypothetical protein
VSNHYSQQEFVLHGSPYDTVPYIEKNGILFLFGEPSFTKNVFLAACRYACMGYNSVRLYSGITLSEAKKLIDKKLIPGFKNEQQILQYARGYWDQHEKEGKVFVVSLAKWTKGVNPYTFLEYEREKHILKGGITKWMEGHIALYPKKAVYKRKSHSSYALFYDKRTHSCLSLDNIVCSFYVTPVIRTEIKLYLKNIHSPRKKAKLKIKFRNHLHDALILNSCASKQVKKEISSQIVQNLEDSYINMMVRKCYLSILHKRGVRILKTDLPEPEDEDPKIFLNQHEINRMLEKLKIMTKFSYNRNGLQEVLDCLNTLEKSTEISFYVKRLSATIEEQCPYV